MDNEYKYIVATLCKTFNHAHYIEEALNGFAIQQTTFPCVYIVIDDASTDGEPQVLRRWAENNLNLDAENGGLYEHKPFGDRYVAYLKNNNNSLFVIILLSENHHGKKPKKPYFAEWTDNAKYRAICEGDDYWTDPLKLQKQVDYLEQHPEVGMVHAKAKVFSQKEQCFHGSCGEQNGGFEQTLVKNPVVTLTSCYRSSLFQKYIAEVSKWDKSGWKMGDYPMWIWMSYYTSFHFMDEVVAVYREVEGSATHPKRLEDNLSFLESTYQIQLFFANLFKQGDGVREIIKYNTNRKKAISCLEYGNSQKAKIYLKKLSFKERWHLRLSFILHKIK